LVEKLLKLNRLTPTKDCNARIRRRKKRRRRRKRRRREFLDLSTEHTLPPTRLLILVSVKHTISYLYLK
jgi:hypothetical protein